MIPTFIAISLSPWTFPLLKFIVYSDFSFVLALYQLLIIIENYVDDEWNAWFRNAWTNWYGARFQVPLYALTGQCAKEFRQQQQKFTVKKREIISNSGKITLSHQVMKMRDRNYQIGWIEDISLLMVKVAPIREFHCDTFICCSKRCHLN